MSATVILVHGAWHGAWCWERVVPELTARGIDTVAVDLPGHGASPEPFGDMYGDAASVRRAIDAVDGPVVLCGHSYGGIVITEAATGHPAVQHLVYLTAFQAEIGESAMASVPTPPDGEPSDLAAAVRFSDDGAVATVDPDLATAAFYHDCTPDDAARAVARLGAQPTVTFSQAVTAAAWHDIPSTYVVCTDDRAIATSLQRALGARATHTEDWPTSHSPFLSRPALVVDLLERLARATPE